MPRHQSELPRTAQAGALARRLIADRFADHLAPTALRDAQIVVSELANNAMVHGEGRITLQAALHDDSLRIGVVDEGTDKVPEIREHAEHDAPGGRGLHIVAALSRRWGVFEGSTHVWADIPLS